MFTLRLDRGTLVMPDAPEAVRGLRYVEVVDLKNRERRAVAGRRGRFFVGLRVEPGHAGGDRKSTRLNSSHRCISYAVFCLIVAMRATPPRPSVGCVT